MTGSRSEWQIAGHRETVNLAKATGLYEVHGSGVRDLLESCAWLWTEEDPGAVDPLAIDEEKTCEGDNLIDT